MKEVKFEHIDKFKNLKFVIEDVGNELGYYLHVQDLITDKCIVDYIQNSIELAKEEVEELYGVNSNIWNRIVS